MNLRLTRILNENRLERKFSCRGYWCCLRQQLSHSSYKVKRVFVFVYLFFHGLHFLPSKLFYIVDVIIGGTITNNFKKIKQKFSKNKKLLPRKGCFGMFTENNHIKKMKRRKNEQK